MKKKYYKYFTAIIIVVPMSFIMSFSSIIINIGFVQGWYFTWFKNSLIMIPVAYVSSIVFGSISNKILKSIKWEE